MLPNWKNRPITIAGLLNPAFCGELIKRFTLAYNKENPTSGGLPFILIFTALPLVLHQDIREKLPKTTGKNLMSWLIDNQEVKSQIPNLIKTLVPYTKEALMFLLAYRAVLINEKGKIDVINKKAKYKPEGNEVLDCIKKAEFLGKWFAKSGTYQSIIISFGIRP